MFDLAKVFTELINDVKTDVINSIQSNNRSATGKTIEAIEIKVNESNAQLLVPGYLTILETGRGGATSSEPKFEIARLQEWCEARGINKSAAWAIKKKINREGYKGTKDLLTTPTSDNVVNARINKQIGNVTDIITKDIAASLK